MDDLFLIVIVALAAIVTIGLFPWLVIAMVHLGRDRRFDLQLLPCMQVPDSTPGNTTGIFVRKRRVLPVPRRSAHQRGPAMPLIERLWNLERFFRRWSGTAMPFITMPPKCLQLRI